MPLTIFGISWPRYFARVKGFGSLRKFWRITTAAATIGNEWWKRKRRDKYCLVSWWCMPNFAVFFLVWFISPKSLWPLTMAWMPMEEERDLEKSSCKLTLSLQTTKHPIPKHSQTLFVYLKWANKFHTARLRDLRPQIILDGKSKFRKNNPPTAIRLSVHTHHHTSHKSVLLWKQSEVTFVRRWQRLRQFWVDLRAVKTGDRGGAAAVVTADAASAL